MLLDFLNKFTGINKFNLPHSFRRGLHVLIILDLAFFFYDADTSCVFPNIKKQFSKTLCDISSGTIQVFEIELFFIETGHKVVKKWLSVAKTVNGSVEIACVTKIFKTNESMDNSDFIWCSFFRGTWKISLFSWKIIFDSCIIERKLLVRIRNI